MLTPEDLQRFLAEDLGDRGDITTLALVPPRQGEARMVAKAHAVLAGTQEAEQVFRHFGVDVEHHAKEGDWVAPGRTVLTARGPARGILTAERLALNLVMRMSGIATLTRTLVDQAQALNPRCKVAATRKTTPGFRAYEKRAVIVGGGDPHRLGLYDAFLVKDNHLALVPTVTEAVRRCRAFAPERPVEIEADTLAQAVEAAEAGADMVLLDNFTPKEAAEASRLLRGRFPKLLIEVSGGITPATLPAYAPHADRVSLGFLTHSVKAIDFGLDTVIDRDQ
ncbi:MAG TPA: carboxylating nicotinate-nucleotide diphosphorylase [Candidatus Thermoplasmatota archaeon]|nr:carboxylating nicotinate-nucleotide diphosphorylase [Candidatus Thermoplasmatota archaeon]